MVVWVWQSFISSHQPGEVVVFSPPNVVNFYFFTLVCIFLQLSWVVKWFFLLTLDIKGAPLTPLHRLRI